MNPAPTVEDYVNEICKVAGVKRFVALIPYHVVLIAAYVIDGIAKPFKMNQPISPVRIRKLVRSNYIVPAYLKKHGYPYQYTFHQAFEDWKKNQPGDWMAEGKRDERPTSNIERPTSNEKQKKQKLEGRGKRDERPTRVLA